MPRLAPVTTATFPARLCIDLPFIAIRGTMPRAHDWTSEATGEYPCDQASAGGSLMPSSVSWNETAMTIAGGKMHLSRAGSGRPVLVLHHDIGTPDRLPFYDTLAQTFDVLVPHHPGWGKSERPQWMRSVRDIAAAHAVAVGRSRLERCIAGGAWFRRLDRRGDGEPGAEPPIASWCWSARWASSRRRATSPIRRSCRTSIIRKRASTTRPRSPVSMAMYLRISSRRGTSRARWCSALRGSRTCTARRCRICSAA